ncbi:MAG: hypothetical protein AB7E49_05400 [Campylobacterales bacterium]
MIDFSLELMGTIAAVFFLLLLFLNITFFQPMLRHLDARKDHLQKDQGSADEDNEEAGRLRDEAAALLARAKQEAHRLKDEAVNAAKAQIENRLSAEREKIAVEMAQFEKTLQGDEEALRNALLGKAPLFKESLKAKFVVAK